MEKLLYEKESYKLRGLWMKIYNILGPGLKESIYANAFEDLLRKERISYKREPNLPVVFEKKKVGDYRPDFLINGRIIVELKSQQQIPSAQAQKIYQYLKSSKYRLGFVVNFGMPQLQIMRRIYDKAQSVKSVVIRNNPRSGFALIEILVAITVFTMMAMGVSYLVLDAYVLNRDAEERMQAVYIAEEGLEAARSIRDNDWGALENGIHGVILSGGNWIFSGTENVVGKYTRVVNVAEITIDEKRITADVTWAFSDKETRTISLVSYLTNWR